MLTRGMTMRGLIFVLVLVAFLYVCECRKHRTRVQEVKGQAVEIRPPSANPFHKGIKYRSGRIRGQHFFQNKKDRKRGKHDRWMKFPKSHKNECKTTKCDHKEFCIVSPKSGAEKCISKRDFKEGRRLFRQFHKEKKHLKDQTQIEQLEKALIKGEHMRDIFDLYNHHSIARAEHQKKHKKQQHVKDVEAKQDAMFKEASNEHECRATELSELKKRLIGWFDVIHTVSRQEHHRQNHHSNLNHHDRIAAFDHVKAAQIQRGHHKQGHKEHPLQHDLDLKHLDRMPVFDHAKKGKILRENKSLYDKGYRTYHRRRYTRSVPDITERESHGNCLCSKSVMWEFRKQDTSVDGHLTEREMVVMESNRREPCMKSLLKSCDKNSDGQLARGEWCCCFQDTVAPCLEKKMHSQGDDWVPRCDKEGYFEREQCHKSGDCWCVDINGNLIENTKTKGKANCGMYGPNGYPIKQ